MGLKLMGGDGFWTFQTVPHNVKKQRNSGGTYLSLYRQTPAIERAPHKASCGLFAGEGFCLQFVKKAVSVK